MPPFPGTVSGRQWIQSAILLVVLVTALAHCPLADAHLGATRAEIEAFYGPAMAGLSNSPRPRFSYDDQGKVEEVSLDAYGGMLATLNQATLDGTIVGGNRWAFGDPYEQMLNSVVKPESRSLVRASRFF